MTSSTEQKYFQKSIFWNSTIVSLFVGPAFCFAFILQVLLLNIGNNFLIESCGFLKIMIFEDKVCLHVQVQHGIKSVKMKRSQEHYPWHLTGCGKVVLCTDLISFFYEIASLNGKAKFTKMLNLDYWKPFDRELNITLIKK